MSIQTFTAAQVLTAAQMNTLQANDYNQTVSTKTASYTLVAADKGTRVVMNVASANTVTVNTSLFSAGDTLVIQNIGAGVTTVTAGTATVSSAGPLTISQYGSGTLYFTSAGVSLWFPSAGPAASSGLTLIAKTTLTASTQHNLLNVFSTSYDHYSVRFTNFSVTTGGINMRYGTSGTPDTGSNYSNNGIYNDDAQVSTTANRFNSSSNSFVNNQSTNMGTFVEISSPFLTQKTTYTVSNSSLGGASIIGNLIRGTVNTATSYTDLVIFGTGDISGVISIYGLANS
jgi:hypothetical protein